MTWLDDVLARLESANAWGYHADAPSATEPAALAAIALVGSGRVQAAAGPLDWLLKLQSADGSVGIDASQAAPGWATCLAVLAWQAGQNSSLAKPAQSVAVERGVAWILNTEGSRFARQEGLGHDSSIAGWPWVEGTHSWAEPTAMDLLALKHTGHGDHSRTRDAVRLLSDRLLENGGCNYGNTYVFGQQLRPHIQPTGLALLALVNETDPTGRVQKSIEYLQRELPQMPATGSLCYGLMGLAGQQQFPSAADAWLAAASRRTLARDPSSYKLALLALAAPGPACPLIPTALTGKAT